MLFLLACTQPTHVTDEPSESAAPVDTAVACGDYATVGQPFAMTYCTSCHGGTQQLGNIQLHTLEALRENADRAAARAGEGTMPPSGGPHEAELERFVTWLQCGAPGDDGGRPADSDVVNPTAGWEVDVLVSELEPDVVLFEFIEPSGTDRGYQVWELQSDGGIALSERARTFEVGAITETFEPALVLWHPNEDAWTQTVTRSRGGDLGTDSWDEEWTVVRNDDPDPRALFTDSLRGFDATTSEGARFNVLFGGGAWVSWAFEDPETGDIAGQSLIFDASGSGGALADGLWWHQRMVRWN